MTRDGDVFVERSGASARGHRVVTAAAAATASSENTNGDDVTISPGKTIDMACMSRRDTARTTVVLLTRPRARGARITAPTPSRAPAAPAARMMNVIVGCLARPRRRLARRRAIPASFFDVEPRARANEKAIFIPAARSKRASVRRARTPSPARCPPRGGTRPRRRRRRARAPRDASSIARARRG